MKNAKLQKQAIMLIERLPKKKLKAAIDYRVSGSKRLNSFGGCRHRLSELDQTVRKNI